MKFTDEQVFVMGSSYPRHRLKERILKQGLIPYECADCGIGPEWNNKKLVLQLEHKNGVNNDHRLFNLCFLCPNCHSQTDTYAGRGTRGLRIQKEKKKPSFRKMKLERDRALLDTLKDDATIRYGEWGWKGRLAKKIGISPQKVHIWLMRVDSDWLRKIENISLV